MCVILSQRREKLLARCPSLVWSMVVVLWRRIQSDVEPVIKQRAVARAAVRASGVQVECVWADAWESGRRPWHTTRHQIPPCSPVRDTRAVRCADDARWAGRSLHCAWVWEANVPCRVKQLVGCGLSDTRVTGRATERLVGGATHVGFASRSRSVASIACPTSRHKLCCSAAVAIRTKAAMCG